MKPRGPPTLSSSVPTRNKERIPDVGPKGKAKLESIKHSGYVINMNQERILTFLKITSNVMQFSRSMGGAYS